jgi:hypothetical protein
MAGERRLRNLETRAPVALVASEAASRRAASAAYTTGLDSVADFRGDTGHPMSERACCAIALAELDVSECPTCGTSGRVVDLQTVKALLLKAALARLELSGYRFCRNAVCETVYFSDSGSTVFGRADLRVPVWQKEPAGARMICYCFGENEADIRREIEQRGTSEAAQRVRKHVRDGRCACDVRNPRGACCLGDVIAAIARAQTPIQPSR